MLIRFTKHANDKFAVLKRHRVVITKAAVIDVVTHPEYLDSVSRAPLYIAQTGFDKRRVLRVVYKVEYGTIVVITFYPGRRSDYEQ